MKNVILLSLTAIIALAFSCTKEQVDEYAMITFIIGDVTKNSQPASIGELIKENDNLVTGGDSFCDVKIGSSIIRIKQRSKVIIANLINKENNESTYLGLDVGKMLCKPKKLLKSEKFIVKTPTAVAGVRGTQFTVETDKARTTRIKVFDGKVKVARRIKKFDNNIDEVLEVAPILEEKEKVVITAKDVVKAEKAVEKIMDIESKKGAEVNIGSIIEQTKNAVSVNNRQSEKFAISDFTHENKELIAVKEKPKEVIKKIRKVIHEEKQEPKPDGRLLITRYEIYFIKNGKVLWEGKVVTSPVHLGDKVYIASGKYVFCASSDGPVLWRKNIDNDGTFELRDNRFIVYSKGKEIALDTDTGQNL